MRWVTRARSKTDLGDDPAVARLAKIVYDALYAWCRLHQLAPEEVDRT
jgi:hypothetical protein